MAAKTRMTLVLGCLVSAASLAQVTGGVVRKAPVDSPQVQQPQPAVPQAPPGPQTQPQNPQVQQMSPQQPLNAPTERKGRNKKDDKGLFGGLF